MPVPPQMGILKVLAYFDIFKYPLTKDEIGLFLGQKMPSDEVALWLQQLAGQHRIFKLGDFYSLQNDDDLRQRRLIGNKKASELLPVAYRVGKFLYQFPFVRGIGISGSLSKNCAGPDADIDLFIITGANRLWIARTIMHVFKKFTFITRHHTWFCMNYYIDEEALQIAEQNIFTATEIATLVPVCGNGTIDDFYQSNEWVSTWYPNINHKRSLYSTRASWIKKMLERLFNNKLGEWLDDYLMRLTSKRWALKEQRHRLNPKGIRLSLRTGKHFSKPFPGYFQNKIVEAWQQKIQDLEKQETVSDSMIV
jgi:hypothetical protein